MYTIIGGDGQKYGPVSADELRRWIAEGRANQQTLAEGGDGVWKPLAAFTEFFGNVGAPQPPPPPPPPPPAQVATRPVYTPASAGPGRTNSMAIAALVLSILGLLCCGPIFSTIGLILGIVSLSQINRNTPAEGGRGLAIAAIAIAVVGYVLFIVFLLSGAWQEILRSFR